MVLFEAGNIKEKTFSGIKKRAQTIVRALVAFFPDTTSGFFNLTKEAAMKETATATSPAPTGYIWNV